MSDTKRTHFPTVAAVLRDIDGWTDLSKPHRQAAKSGLSALVRLHRLPAEAVRLDPKATIERFQRGTPAELACSVETYRSYFSACRQVLRRLGLLRARTRRAEITDPDWRALADQLPNNRREYERLRHFMAYCSSRGVAPATVSQSDLVAYCEDRFAERGGGKEHDNARRIASLWRSARRDNPDWPSQELRPTRDHQVSMPLDGYPPSMVEDIEKYRSWLLGEREGADERFIKARSPGTVKTRIFAIRRLLHGAVTAGQVPADFDRLARLLEPEIYKASLRWHLSHKPDGKPNADTDQLFATLMTIASFVGLSGPAFSTLKGDAKRGASKPRRDVTAKLSQILDRLDEPARQAKLLHLPGLLMREADRLRLGWQDKSGGMHVARPKAAGHLAGVAVAIEILLTFPLRLENLIGLRLGREVQFPFGRSSTTPVAIRIEPEHVKNHVLLEGQLDGASAKLLHRYLEDFRPLLPHHDTNWLFPGESGPDNPRSGGALGRAISDVTHRNVGVAIHPHAFRAIAASLLVGEGGNPIDAIRSVLGHRTTNTATTYYRRWETRSAVAKVAEIVQRRRHAGPASISPGRGGAGKDPRSNLQRGRTRVGPDSALVARQRTKSLGTR